MYAFFWTGLLVWITEGRNTALFRKTVFSDVVPKIQSIIFTDIFIMGKFRTVHSQDPYWLNFPIRRPYFFRDCQKHEQHA
jgi:hypothetical protein